MSPAKKKTKPAAKRSVKKAGVKAGELVPQKHGGAIHQGAPANPVAGTGRPPDAIRAAMRELGANKGLPFLDDVLGGKLAVTLVGTCSVCGEESSAASVDWMKDLLGDVKASVDQRIKALEQAWKYGLGTKDEVSFTNHPEYQRRIAALRKALVEALGDDGAARVVMRAEALASG